MWVAALAITSIIVLALGSPESAVVAQEQSVKKQLTSRANKKFRRPRTSNARPAPIEIVRFLDFFGC